MKRFAPLFSLVLLIFISGTSFAQVKIDSAEITSEVPALSDFHEIVFPMWHNAYPAKDIKALKSFIPGIKSSMEAINNAKLPGILSGKEEDWKKQLIEFNTAANDYYAAAEKNDDAALLAATEALHHNFEMMMRVIRPVLKEIDDYHQMLYIIYHKLYPEKNFDEIAKMSDALIQRADAIVKYPTDKLKKRLGDKISSFTSASEALYQSTVALKEDLKGTDPEKKSAAVEKMHENYVNLVAVFN